jgi:hypothetical protein
VLLFDDMRLVVAILGCLASGCLIDISAGTKCDDTRPCADGRACVMNKCSAPLIVSDAGRADAGMSDGGKVDCSVCTTPGHCKIECLKTDFGPGWSSVFRPGYLAFDSGSLVVDGGVAMVTRTGSFTSVFFESTTTFDLDDSQVSVQLLRSDAQGALGSRSYLEIFAPSPNNAGLILGIERNKIKSEYHVNNTDIYISPGEIEGPLSGTITFRISARADVIVYDAYFDGQSHFLGTVPNPLRVPLKGLQVGIGNDCYSTQEDGGYLCSAGSATFDNLNLP